MNKKSTYLMIFNKISVRGKRAERFEILLSLSLLFFISAVYFYWFGNGIFFFQENRTLFIYTGEYFQKFLIKPGGILEYVGNFLTQSYYNHVTGSLIISSFPVLIFAIFIKINKQLSPDRSYSLILILLPSCLLLLLQTNYEHFMHYNLGFLLVALWFNTSIASGNVNIRIILLTLFPLFYYLAGSFALIYLALYIMYSLIYDKGILRYFIPVFLISVTFLTFMLFREVIFLQPSDQLLTYPLPFKDITKLPILFCLFSGYLIFFPLIVKVTDALKTIWNHPPFNYLLLLTVFPVTITLLIKYYDNDQADLMQLEKLVFEQNWDAVITRHESSPLKSLVGQYYYNLALSEKGLLCDRLFFGRQDFGAKSLFLPRDKEYINRAVYFYYTIGLSGEAHHLAYESMVIYGNRPENIKLLVKTELINGNFKIAEHYINILKKTLHYRKWAEKYEKMLYNQAMINSDPELGKKISLIPKRDFFISSNDIYNIELILQGNPDNKRAFEYKIAQLLLEKDFEAVVYQVKKMKDMGYNFIPRHIEEALVLFINLNLELPYLGELTISPETESRFKQFETILDLNNSKTEQWPEKKMKKAEENTFWYYFYLDEMQT